MRTARSLVRLVVCVSILVLSDHHVVRGRSGTNNNNRRRRTAENHPRRGVDRGEQQPHQSQHVLPTNKTSNEEYTNNATVVLVSWYTSKYAAKAERLRRSCAKHSVDLFCDVVEVPDAYLRTVKDGGGSFQLFKVLFMLGKLLGYPGKDVMYVDADIVMQAPLMPHLRRLQWPQQGSSEEGVGGGGSRGATGTSGGGGHGEQQFPSTGSQHQPAAAFFNWRASRPAMPPTIATGVVLLRNTPCGRQLLRLWAAGMGYVDWAVAGGSWAAV